MDYVLAVLPILPGLCLTLQIADVQYIYLMLWSHAIAFISFLITTTFIPVFAEYSKSKGICGKDLGKKGTSRENDDIPEALGLLCGIVFLISTISTQLLTAKTSQQLVIFNSALFSICFMIFLGFIDDILDLKWRYKLILPSIASLPLLSAYSGSTAVYIPAPFQYLLMENGQLTLLGSIINMIFVVDTEAKGNIVELGYYFLLFMGLLAVFCTNAINIMAGINGLECGQSYVIAASTYFFKMYDIVHSDVTENEIFALILIIPFLGTCLGLLRHNWYPAKVFVGDTFCYFAGMTFAVVGIHGHFSKTLLLLFIPQIFNFIYSIPQLFKFLPCPRHRLPRINPDTKLMTYSAFPCESNQYKWLKVHSDATECPNLTILCAVLRLFGPMKERSLCISLMIIQSIFSVIAFYVSYILLKQP